MASDNPTWGAPRIHGELLKLGFDVSERTVSRYLERIRPEPRRTGSQTWSTFLRNQAKGIVAVALFTVPTVRFQVLYVFVVVALERRRLVFANVTTSPTALWLGQQTVNAFPWDTAPRFLIRDRDKVYENLFSRHLALEKDAPDYRSVEPPEMGEVISLTRLGGLHHRYSSRAA